MVKDKDVSTEQSAEVAAHSHHFGSLTTVLLVVFLASVVGLLGYAAGMQSQPDTSTDLRVIKKSQKKAAAYSGPDLMSYTPNDELFTVKKVVMPVDEVLDPGAWEKSDGLHTVGFYTNLLKNYTAKDKAVQYQFRYVGESQTGPWLVTVIPNKLGYKTRDEFAKDFPADAAGDSYYAAEASAQYLSFVSSCGTGYADDSGKTDGCTKVQDFVSPTIKLK